MARTKAGGRSRSQLKRNSKLFENGYYVHSSPPKAMDSNSGTGSATIREHIRAGDLEALEEVILQGQGAKLVNQPATDHKVRAFLKTVSAYMNKIDLVHDAAAKGNLRDLKALLDRRKLARSKDSSGTGLLHKAVQGGHSKVVDYLCSDYPESIEVTDSGPPSRAEGDLETVKRWLGKGNHNTATTRMMPMVAPTPKPMLKTTTASVVTQLDTTTPEESARREEAVVRSGMKDLRQGIPEDRSGGSKLGTEGRTTATAEGRKEGQGESQLEGRGKSFGLAPKKVAVGEWHELEIAHVDAVSGSSEEGAAGGAEGGYVGIVGGCVGSDAIGLGESFSVTEERDGNMSPVSRSVVKKRLFRGRRIRLPKLEGRPSSMTTRCSGAGKSSSPMFRLNSSGTNAHKYSVRVINHRNCLEDDIPTERYSSSLTSGTPKVRGRLAYLSHLQRMRQGRVDTKPDIFHAATIEDLPHLLSCPRLPDILNRPLSFSTRHNGKGRPLTPAPSPAPPVEGERGSEGGLNSFPAKSLSSSTKTKRLGAGLSSLMEEDGEEGGSAVRSGGGGERRKDKEEKINEVDREEGIEKDNGDHEDTNVRSVDGRQKQPLGSTMQNGEDGEENVVRGSSSTRRAPQVSFKGKIRRERDVPLATKDIHRRGSDRHSQKMNRMKDIGNAQSSSDDVPQDGYSIKKVSEAKKRFYPFTGVRLEKLLSDIKAQVAANLAALFEKRPGKREAGSKKTAREAKHYAARLVQSVVETASRVINSEKGKEALRQ